MLPSSSLIYKAVNYKANKFKGSIGVDIEDNIIENISSAAQRRSGFFSIKIDELAITPKIRYNSDSNETRRLSVSNAEASDLYE